MASSGISSVRGQVDEVKEHTRQNINKVVERGDKLEDLQGKADLLKYEAGEFRKTGVKVKRNEQCKSYKLTFILIAVILVIIFVIALGIVIGVCASGHC